MASYWLVVGTPEHWQVAFENGNIWGLQQVKIRWWDRLSEGDGLIFYVTRPVGGAIGLGKVSTKFKQDKPLWPREVEEQRVLWQSVPTYVFEVQVGGDIYHAIAKLKHAYDLWNSRIFIVAAASERTKFASLMSGTFHEVRERLQFIEIPKLEDLYSPPESGGE